MLRFIIHQIAITHQQFIVGDDDGRFRARPLEFTATLIAFNNSDRSFRRPHRKLALPVRYQWLRANQQHAFHFSCQQQQANRCDRLHRFPKTHLVCQDGRIARIEKGDPGILIRERFERKTNLVTRYDLFERRLQDVEESILELDDVAGRLQPSRRFRLTNFLGLLKKRWLACLGVLASGQANGGVGFGECKADRPNLRLGHANQNSLRRIRKPVESQAVDRYSRLANSCGMHARRKRLDLDVQLGSS